MRLDYWLYMNETSGNDSIVDTRLAKINAIGKDLQKAGYAGKVVPAAVFLSYCAKHKVDNITQEEIKHIEEEWL